jgi:hypothetical protein
MLMAINPSNSNAINIVNLPSAQLAVAGDYLILQTNNGTQKINFNDFNVVRTDIFGNATVIGNLTGNDISVDNVVTANITASNFFTTQGQGINASNGFYDRFTIQDGLILSADRNTKSNPLYTEITNTYMPSVTSSLANMFSKIYDYSSTATIVAGSNTTTIITINQFFANYPITITQITRDKFTVVPQVGTLTQVPTVNNIQQIGQNLQFQIAVGSNLASNVTFNWRLLVTYT